MRNLRYSEAILEATYQLMENDEKVFIIGQGVTSPWYVGNTCNGLLKKFGSERVIDTPISENAVTGCAIGSSLIGLRPILVHPRMDFMYLAFDQIINQAANWYYMFGKAISVPLTIRGIINRGGEQGAQHSQDLHSLFGHIPGLKVVCPSTPYDAKGLLISSINDNNPIIYIEDRWLYDEEGDVPKEIYQVPIGKGIKRRNGDKLTIVGLGYVINEAIKAADQIKKEGIDIDVIDLRSAKPIDEEIIIESLKKTGRLMVVDGSWKTISLSSEIIAIVSEKAFSYLNFPPVRLSLPDLPAPSSTILEKEYYINAKKILIEIRKIIDITQID